MKLTLISCFFFFNQDVKHVVASKIKEIEQLPIELVIYYEKIFKDLFSYIPYINDKDWLWKCFITKFLQKVRVPFRMEKNYVL